MIRSYFRRFEINQHMFDSAESDDDNEYLLNSFECDASYSLYNNTYKIHFYDKFIMVCNNGKAFKVYNFSQINIKPSVFKLFIQGYYPVPYNKRPITILHNGTNLVLFFSKEQYDYIGKYLQDRQGRSNVL